MKRESEAEEKRVRLEAMRRETAAREARAQEQEEELRMLQSTQHKQASRIKEKGEAIKALTSQQETLAQAEPLDGPTIARYKALARDCGLWLSCGGFHERPRVVRLHRAGREVEEGSLQLAQQRHRGLRACRGVGVAACSIATSITGTAIATVAATGASTVGGATTCRRAIQTITTRGLGLARHIVQRRQRRFQAERSSTGQLCRQICRRLRSQRSSASPRWFSDRVRSPGGQKPMSWRPLQEWLRTLWTDADAASWPN